RAGCLCSGLAGIQGPSKMPVPGGYGLSACGLDRLEAQGWVQKVTSRLRTFPAVAYLQGKATGEYPVKRMQGACSWVFSITCANQTARTIWCSLRSRWRRPDRRKHTARGGMALPQQAAGGGGGGWCE
ncbi:unnamed protein product, partial [Heterosigma akashiwo]